LHRVIFASDVALHNDAGGVGFVGEVSDLDVITCETVEAWDARAGGGSRGMIVQARHSNGR
jgi:hypothetical protein